ncbi:MAG: hypothetical protein ACK5VI_10980 [Opitutia bacterium]
MRRAIPSGIRKVVRGLTGLGAALMAAIGVVGGERLIDVPKYNGPRWARSKYQPHQGEREKARRRDQMDRGILRGDSRGNW